MGHTVSENGVEPDPETLIKLKIDENQKNAEEELKDL